MSDDTQTTLVMVDRGPFKGWVEYRVDGVWHKERAPVVVNGHIREVQIPAHATRGDTVRAWIECDELVISSGDLAVRADINPATTPGLSGYIAER